MYQVDPIALAATFISGCALFATIWQAHISRKHNRISVQPSLVWNRKQSITNAGIEVAFSIKNCGAGLAMVRDRFFIIDGQRFETSTNQDEILELAETLLGQKLPYVIREHGLPGIGSSIPPNEESLVVKIFFPGANSPLLNSALSGLAGVNFCLAYKSLYDEPFFLIRAL
jgi:hypothetical protein